MRLAAPISLAAGALFGAGLALSGMTDPARVRAFLDLGGAWNPALAFVMAGAIVPMGVAWTVARRMERPLAAARFDLPGRTELDRPLLIGAALFGVGWGLAGLCPGPGVASLAARPGPAATFTVAMLAGMAAHGAWARLPAPTQPQRSRIREEEIMRNMGAADRAIRLLVVVGIAIAYFVGAIGGTLALVLGAVALVFLATSLFATCPAYMPFGISTRGRG